MITATNGATTTNGSAGTTTTGNGVKVHHHHRVPSAYVAMASLSSSNLTRVDHDAAIVNNGFTVTQQTSSTTSATPPTPTINPSAPLTATVAPSTPTKISTGSNSNSNGTSNGHAINGANGPLSPGSRIRIRNTNGSDWQQPVRSSPEVIAAALNNSPSPVPSSVPMPSLFPPASTTSAAVNGSLNGHGHHQKTLSTTASPSDQSLRLAASLPAASLPPSVLHFGVNAPLTSRPLLISGAHSRNSSRADGLPLAAAPPAASSSSSSSAASFTVAFPAASSSTPAAAAAVSTPSHSGIAPNTPSTSIGTTTIAEPSLSMIAPTAATAGTAPATATTAGAASITITPATPSLSVSTSNASTIPSVSTPGTGTAARNAIEEAKWGAEEKIEMREWENKEHHRINEWGEIIEDRARDKERQKIEETEAAKKSKYLRRERDREMKWVEMTRDWTDYIGKHPDKVKERIRKGIPDALRGKVWPLLTGAGDMRTKQPDLYQRLLSKPIARDDDIQIRKDLPRDCQNHIMFRSPVAGSRTIFCRGQIAMYNVFHAYSAHHREIGYVQGMMSIGGLALMYVPEEEAFWMLESILNGPHALRGLYENDMPLSKKFVYVFDKLLARKASSLRNHIKRQGLPHTAYSFRWLTTRFSEFPRALVVRIFDIFLHEGMKIVFRVSLLIMKTFESRLLKLDLEGMMMLFNSLPTDPIMSRADDVIAAALKVDITTSELDRLSSEYDIDRAREAALAKQGIRSNHDD